MKDDLSLRVEQSSESKSSTPLLHSDEMREAIAKLILKKFLGVDGFQKSSDLWDKGCLELADEIRAALSTPQAPWRDIRSAPKDGTEILVTNIGEGMLTRIVAWRDYSGLGERWRIVHSDMASMKPTHWIPLPTPPALIGDGDQK